MKRNLILIALAFLLTTFITNAQIGTASHASASTNNHHEKNGNHTFATIFDSSACGLNYSHSSTLIETRYNVYAVSTIGSGMPANVSITDLPPGALILKAYLYWQESYHLGTSDTQTVHFTNPNGNHLVVPGTLIGQDQPICWAEMGTYSFRADVTSNVIGENGSYQVDAIDGVYNPGWEVDGTTLIVIYKDPNATYTGTLVINDGIISIVSGVVSQSITNLNVCQTPSHGKGFLVSSDFQDNVLSGVHNTIINGDTISFPSLFYCFDEAPVDYIIGQTALIVGIPATFDCYSLSVAGAYYQDTCSFCNLYTPCSANFTLTPDTNVQHHYWAINNATGVPPLQYLWSWGDSTYDSIPYPSHIYADSGLYNICLTITDSIGCTSTFCDSSYDIQRTTNTIYWVNVISPSQVGIQEINIKNDILIYPNPTNTTLTLHSTMSIVNSQLLIEDVLGNKIHQQTITGINTTLDVSKWSEGVYFYEINGLDGIMRGKFIKEK